MVVQCQSCEARFRVADDKVTERGVRVRCTGCRTVFLVKRDGSQAPLQTQVATGETVMGMAPISARPQAAGSSAPPGAAQRSVGPRAAAAPAVRTAPPPPPLAPRTSATAPRTSSPPARAAAAPSTAPRNGAAGRPALDDPFGMSELTEGPAPSKAPPARPPAAKPATAPPSKQPQGLRSRPRADLPADLDIDIGGPSPAPAARPRSMPPPPPGPTASAPLTIGRLGKSKFLPDEPQAPSVSSTNGVASKPPPPPPLWDDEEASGDEQPPKNGADEAETPSPGADGIDPSSEARPALHDPFAGMELDAESGQHAPLHASDPSLARLGKTSPGDAGEPQADEPQPSAEQPGPAPELDAPLASPRSPRRQIVSSALTGLVGAALALLLAVGPSALFSGRFSELVGAGDIVAVQEASGLYDTISGRPIFFVRGHVENRGKRMSGPVRIVATLVGDSGPAARAESVAGPQLTPEDVYGLRSAADADRLIKALALKSTADRRVPPGGSLPFLALFTDPPGNLSHHKIQLRLESAETATSR